MLDPYFGKMQSHYRELKRKEEFDHLSERENNEKRKRTKERVAKCRANKKGKFIVIERR